MYDTRISLIKNVSLHSAYPRVSCTYLYPCVSDTGYVECYPCPCIVATYLAKKDFVGEGTVDVRGIKEGDPAVNGMVDESDHVLVGL